MAAGAGSRFGFRPKGLLQRDGEALLARQLRLLAQAGVSRRVVVLGHHAGDITALLRKLRAQPAQAGLSWVVNPTPDDGPGSSLRCGLASLPEDLDGVLVLLGDQPLLEPQDLRVQEIMENLDRKDLTKLERAESLALLKVLHEQLYPETRNGGDRKSAAAKRRKNQNEIFSFRSAAAEKTGLSRRAIEIAVAIVAGLAPDVKPRLRGTWLADHQAGLRQLAEQEPELQHKVCDLLFAVPPEATSVADAIVLAEGGRLKTSQEKLFTSVMNNFARLSERDRRAVLAANEDAIRAYATEKGWI